MNKVIDIQNVDWRRDGNVILSEINWQVNRREHWAVLGLNGSGKTTLLNIINGYIWPTSGKVSVLDQHFGKTDIRELRKSIGWVSSSLQEKINGMEYGENVVVSGKYASIGLYEQPAADDYQRARELMEQLGCSHLANRKYQTCSQGEKQKILIARGLMASPDLLILDEPTNGLDFISREGLLAAIQQLAAQEDAPTIIFVTHHIEEILPIFNHTLLLRHGTVFNQGKTKDVLTSESLSHFFDIPLEVSWRKNRAWMTIIA
ncbi:ATP-binding cassette domain-containing protein [Oceanobacillus sp. 143]|uniref:Molybdenum ABC transporter ATP-binding protein n=1 Tax=Oceanobacillus zhaokaii TaxID=2052660 RepID=A0A345PJV3_9BACI|nr:ABC transporter ATP-binding protein [Oceanobacillus zhaokaii]AXI10283.1 molybdenum ABC transporter ATP-binding protein [Oceanobacillus zhaokaii]QGS69338.1 ATP-binding cassette domain-containing protein [Oceanobacillus sp. 143]